MFKKCLLQAMFQMMLQEPGADSSTDGANSADEVPHDHPLLCLHLPRRHLPCDHPVLCRHHLCRQPSSSVTTVVIIELTAKQNIVHDRNYEDGDDDEDDDANNHHEH